MKSSLPVLFLWLLLSACRQPIAVPHIDFRELSWMTGEWQAIPWEGARINESWKWGSDSLLQGTSFTIENGDTTFFESLEIIPAEGSFALEVLIEGRERVVFQLARYRYRSLTFENPDHDFPQRIIYESKNDSTLYARIEGETYDGKKSKEFWYKKIK